MSDHGQVERYEKQVHELQSQVKFLEEEVGLMRRRLTNAPRQVTILEEKLVETREQLTRAMSQNEKLAETCAANRANASVCASRLTGSSRLSQPHSRSWCRRTAANRSPIVRGPLSRVTSGHDFHSNGS